MSDLIESIVARRYEDKYARQEWAWRHRYSMEANVDDFAARVKLRTGD